MLKYKKLISVFEDDPDDDRGADECTDGIDRECVAVGRELAHDVAQEQERCANEHRARNGELVVGCLQQTTNQMRHSHADESNWSSECCSGTSQEGNSNDD